MIDAVCVGVYTLAPALLNPSINVIRAWQNGRHQP